jgi:hypothetical protein
MRSKNGILIETMNNAPNAGRRYVAQSLDFIEQAMALVEADQEVPQPSTPKAASRDIATSP